MIQKMRWRFVEVALISFATVILILLVTINVWNYHTVINSMDDSISIIQNINDNGFPVETFPNETITDSQDFPFNPGNIYSPEIQYMIRFFTVQYNKSGTIENINKAFIATESEENIVAYADSIQNTNKNTGFKEKYRYRVYENDTGKLIVFLNVEREIQSIKSLLIITGVIALICLLGVFLVAFLLSKRAIEPFRKNLDMQKQFITNASHELKTPLTSISTSADVLAMEKSDNEWVMNIQSQCVQMKKMISNLMILSRLDEEKPFQEKTTFSLSDMIWEISEPFSVRARAAGKQLKLEVEEDILITGDEGSIRQSISALLDNAIKYCDEEGIIRIKLVKRGKKGELFISNTFVKAPLLDTSRFFERFYRDNTTMNQVSGAGIGLSIVQSAIHANGGRIEVSAQNNLVTFKITI